MGNRGHGALQNGRDFTHRDIGTALTLESCDLCLVSSWKHLRIRVNVNFNVPFKKVPELIHASILRWARTSASGAFGSEDGSQSATVAMIERCSSVSGEYDMTDHRKPHALVS